MRGNHAFCPQTGAPLEDENEHVSLTGPADDTVHGLLPTDTAASTHTQHAPEIDPSRGDEPAPLTSGSKKSNAQALTRRFRDTYDEHHQTTPSQLMVESANAIRTLRQTTREAADTTLWYALAEKLHRDGYAVEWMFNHVEPSCPDCGSVLVWEHNRTDPDADGDAVLGRCAGNCDVTHEPDDLTAWNATPSTGAYRDRQILARILKVYNKAFTGYTDPDDPGFASNLLSRDMPFDPDFEHIPTHPASYEAQAGQASRSSD